MNLIIAAIIVVASVVIDLVSKAIVAGNMQVFQSIPIIPNVLHITYVKNTGAAFSILENQMLFFYILTPIALIAFIWYLIKVRKGSKFQIVSLALIIGGTIGNFVDRVFLQYVRDFIEFRFVDFAIFNFADICLTVGVVFFVIYLLVDIIKDSKKKGNNGTGENN